MSEPAPVTTRVGGGISPRAAAAVFAVALAGIVVAAFVNRPPDQQPSSHLALAATPTPKTSSEATTPAPPTAAPPARLYQSGTALQQDAFAAIALIGRRQYPVLLLDDGNGTLAGSMRMPLSLPDTKGTLELAQLWSLGPELNFQSIGRWYLPLDPLLPEVRSSATVLRVEQGSGPRLGDNRLARSGFQLDVRLESRTDFSMIFVTVTTQVATHHRIYGEDGIFGLPGWPWRADDTPSATATPAPSRYVFKWLGRYWPGPAQKLTR